MASASEDRTVVGVFRDDEAAKLALRQVDASGFSPDRVWITSDAREAREPAGSFSPRSAIIGALIGAVLTVVFALLIGQQVGQNPAAVVLGGAGFVAAGALIGALAGRGRALKKGEYRELERPVERGGALLTISCTAADLDRARKALREAGASAVRVKETGETL